MRYFLRVLLVLVLSVGVVTGVYYYTNNRTLPGQTATHRLTTVSKAPATEKYAARTLIAGLEDFDFSLYKSGRNVILEHNGKEFVYENWSSVIDAESPEMYYRDIDGDPDRELIIRAVSGQDNETKEYAYDLYILNPKAGKKEAYDVLLISQDTWRTVLNEAITEELSQLKSCNKFLQLAMDKRSKGITYNDETGAVEQAAYVAYAAALRGDNGYLTFDNWTRSMGVFTLTDDGYIDVAVEVLARYKETAQKQDLGNIHFKLEVTDKNLLRITEKSVRFEAKNEYRASNPTKKAKKKWHYVRNNAYKPEGSGKIRLIEYGLQLDENAMTDTDSLGGEATDVKFVKSVKIDEGELMFTAADGYTFSKDAADKGEYAVVINRGSEDEYEISYKARMNQKGDILKIEFDRTYDKNEIKTIDIRYGVR